MTYSKKFKVSAVKSLFQLKKEGIVVINNYEIMNVRDLVSLLGVSSNTLYKWSRLIDLSYEEDIEDVIPEIETIEIKEINGLSGDNFDFGVRFWGFVAKNMKIRNYAQMNLKTLKEAIANRLLDE